MQDRVLFPLLELLQADEKQHALSKMQLQKAGDNVTIYERGEHCTDAFFIFEGTAKFCTFGPNGEMAFFWRRYPGDIFGFYSAITEQPQTTTAIAVGKTVLGRMKSADFMDMVLSHRALSEHMLKLVTHMLRSETSRVTQLITMDASLRVVTEILDYVAASGNAVFYLPSRNEMAARLGMTRETLSRHLSDLSKKGLIVMEKDKIQISDIQQLADLLR